MWIGWSMAGKCPWVNAKDIVTKIAFLFNKSYASSTINLYISAISFVRKMNNWEDPTHSFIIGKLREGCRCLGHSTDGRRPVTFPLLKRILEILPSICAPSFEVVLFRAACGSIWIFEGG